MEFVRDVDVHYLVSGALVSNRRSRTSIRNPIVPERMERSLDFEEELISRHSRECHAGRLKRCFYSGHQAAKLRDQVFVLAATSLNTFSHCHAETTVTHLLL